MKKKLEKIEKLKTADTSKKKTGLEVEFSVRGVKVSKVPLEYEGSYCYFVFAPKKHKHTKAEHTSMEEEIVEDGLAFWPRSSYYTFTGNFYFDEQLSVPSADAITGPDLFITVYNVPVNIKLLALNLSSLLKSVIKSCYLI